ncbi:MAG TPA: hypothetical protein DDZ88_00445 [Verrucomicrobiales bacterium]|nr:hypothetical protein [Verrucomicrobiales bacterium]
MLTIPMTTDLVAAIPLAACVLAILIRHGFWKSLPAVLLWAGYAGLNLYQNYVVEHNHPEHAFLSDHEWLNTLVWKAGGEICLAAGGIYILFLLWQEVNKHRVPNEH